MYGASALSAMQPGSAGAAWCQVMYEGHVKGPPLAASSHLSSVPAFMSSWVRGGRSCLQGVQECCAAGSLTAACAVFAEWNVHHKEEA